MLDQCTLVLEGVTLAELVEFVVEVLVNLASSTVLDKQTSEDTQASHPEDLAVTHIISTPLLLIEPALSCVMDSIHHT